MATVAAGLSEPYFSKIEVDIIEHDDEIVMAESKVPERQSHRMSAPVHVCHGLDENHSSLIPRGIVYAALKFWHPPEFHLFSFGEETYDHEPYVVARYAVHNTGIAEPGYKISFYLLDHNSIFQRAI